MRRLLALSLLVTGCRKIDPAPEALDDLLHYLWTELNEGADDERLAEGIVNLDAAVKAARLEEPEDGTVTPLTRGEAALVGVTDRDPKDAAGVYLVNTYACSRPMLEQILSHAEQDVLYDGVYDSYSRTYDQDQQDFLDGSIDELTWQLEYHSSSIVGAYDARAEALMRRVPELDGELTPWGPILFTRTYMPRPADFENDNKSMDQDYQLEMYWEREKGQIVHVYGLWRQAFFGSGLSSDDKGVQRILLNNLLDWDETTEQVCADGLP